MQHAVRNAGGGWSGVVYDALTAEIIAHHAQYGDTVEPVPGLENIGSIDAPNWRPLGAEALGAVDINAERASRVAAGTYITVTGHAEPVALQGRIEDQQTLMGLAMMAQMRQAGEDATLTTFRDRENVDHDLTPAQILELWMRGAAWIEQVYRASWALKDQDPVPADFTDDRHWPAANAAPTQP